MGKHAFKISRIQRTWCAKSLSKKVQQKFKFRNSRWRHQMEIFSTLLALCARNSPVTSEFPSQRPVTRSFDIFVDLRRNKRLSKQLWGWWFETPSRSLRRHSHAKKTWRATHPPKLVNKKCKYKIDPASIVEDMERTRFGLLQGRTT